MPTTAAEVWNDFKPKLAAAREQDRAQVALSFLPIIVPLGRFEITPLTVEKMLWLEQVESPFVTGGEPARVDVLAFLWICSPQFRIGEKYGKRFCLNHCFIRWKKYAVWIFDYMTDLSETMGGGNAKDGVDMNWLPSTIDAFASQYHWSHDEIMKMPIQRVSILAHAMTSRLSEKAAPPTFSPHADRVRTQMLKEINRVETEAKSDGKR